ncbi:MAG TPA: FKBP-type peptidyl-prolyl cis-trans isomerase [Flavisolibacter sp.]|jgi:FKBP-type peptidyl-prolyl cis-trans isomerase FklB|nr:FKBP-type peptidyl-prolyl cis-trans isomerase [Flavisolibacter sp.]
MKKILVAVALIVSVAACAQKSNVKKTISKKTTGTSQSLSLKTLEDSASYAIGVSVANFYSQQGLKNINTTLVAKAISDIYSKKKPVMDESTCNSVVMRLMNNMQSEKSKPNIEAGEAFLIKNKSNPAVKTTSSGLQYEVITQGTGPKPSATDTVVVHYKGTLLNGTEFDNSYKRGEPITFPLNHVIAGWTEGLQLMAVGSKYKLYIPYQLAYGANDNGPIPGGSVLIFEVELLSIKGK